MARKYYFKFKTFQNHTCRVDIYDADYSGTAIELNKDVAGSPGCPAGSPVVIEEDNSEDLLEVVRTKTGYLRLIELTAGGLTPLFPKTNDQLEVYVLIDVADNTAAPNAPMETVFHGYIQAQSFDSDYAGYRQELKIPIQSISNVIGEQPIDADHIDTIADIFQYSFQEYEYIVMPVITVENFYDEDTFNVLEMGISKEILAPANNNYNYGVIQNEGDDEPKPLEPITKAEFLEKFCHTFGLISHDVGTMIMFSKVGYTGEYRKYANDGHWDDYNWNAGYGNTVISFGTNFSFSTDKNQQSNVNSTKSVAMEWEKIDLPQEIDFSIAKYRMDSRFASRPALLDYKGLQINAFRWLSGTDDTNVDGCCISGDGENEGLYVHKSSGSKTYLFDCTFASPCKINSVHLETFTNMHGGYMYLKVYHKGLFFNFAYPRDEEDQQWIEDDDNAVWGNLSALEANGVLDIPIEVEGMITLIFYNQGLVTYEFKEISIKNINNINKYTQSQNEGNIIYTLLDSTSKNEATANIDFWRYADKFFNKPTFNYLGISQRNLTLQVRKKTSITELDLLMCKMAMSSTDQTNRVISTRYNVRDDIFELQIMGNQYF